MWHKNGPEVYGAFLEGSKGRFLLFPQMSPLETNGSGLPTGSVRLLDT